MVGKCRHEQWKAKLPSLRLISESDIYLSVNHKHRKTLEAIFRRPTKADIQWSAIESLVIACGGTVAEREGSRVAVVLNGVRANFHRPHPKPTTKKGAVDAARVFLINAGIKL